MEYPKPDGVTTFDLPTSLYRSGGVVWGFGSWWGFVDGQGSLHVSITTSQSDAVQQGCWSLGCWCGGSPHVIH